MWLAIGILLLMLLFSPFRAWILRRKIEFQKVDSPFYPPSCGDAAPAGGVAVLLIHGTYSRNAPWTATGGFFITKLVAELQACAITRLLWSGDNSFGERVKTAKSVARWIAEQTADTIYLIGHSHGGYIAALGASMAKDDRVRLVTMSTPFIDIVARPIPTSEATIDGLSDSCRFVLIFVWISLTQAFQLVGRAAGVTEDEAYAITFGVLNMIYPIVCIVFWKWIRSGFKRLFEVFNSYAARLSRLGRIDVPDHRMTVCRVTADEASGLLAISQVTCWIVSRIHALAAALSRHIRRMEYFISNSIMQTRFGLVLTVGLVILAMFYEVTGGVRGGAGGLVLALLCIGVFSMFRYFSLAVEATLAIPVLIIRFLLHLPFGIELAASAPLVNISVEATPVGKWRTVLVNNQNSSLAHSALYEQEEIFAELHQLREAGSADALHDAARTPLQQAG